MTRSVTRILVPTDFSEASDAALEYAGTLAGRLGASIHLLHVFEDPYLAGGAFAAEMYAPLPSELRETLIAEAKQQLQVRLARLVDEQWHATADIYTGPTAKAIVDYATDKNVDLIVMGTHGRRAVAHLLLGSVAERVVRIAPCPVLTVRAATATIPAAAVAA